MSMRLKDETAFWFVVRCQPKREHIASQFLAKMDGIESYCPRIRYRKVTRRGKIWWVEPLFPGYLFAHFLYPEYHRQVAACHGVTQILGFGGTVPNLSNEVVRELQAQSRAEGDEDVIEFQTVLANGDEVEIAEGPFKGIKGIVEEPLEAKERVKILIEFLGQDQLVELDLLSLILPKKPRAEFLNQKEI